MKSLEKMLTEGRIPKRAWNNLVREVEALVNMDVGPGLGFRKGAKYLLTLTAKPKKIITFGKEGKLVEIASNVCQSLLLIDPIRITNIWTYVETPSTSGTIDLDINVSSNPGTGGTSLYPAADKPSIAQDAYSDLDSVPDTKSIAKGKYIYVDLDAVGTGAEDLTVIIFGR